MAGVTKPHKTTPSPTHLLAQGCYSRERSAGAGENAHKTNGMEPASSKMASDVLLKSMTHDIVSVLTEQHNSLLLALAAQTQKLEEQTRKLNKLEQVCMHRNRSDEPMFEELVQTVVDLKERLGKLRSAQQGLARENAREGLRLPSVGHELKKTERFEALTTLYQQPFSDSPVVLNPRARSGCLEPPRSMSGGRFESPRSIIATDVSHDDIASPLFGPDSPQDKGQRVKESRGDTATRGKAEKRSRGAVTGPSLPRSPYSAPGVRDMSFEATARATFVSSHSGRKETIVASSDGSLPPAICLRRALSRYPPVASLEIDLPG